MGLMGYYLIAGVMFLVGMIVSNRLKSKFTEYSQIGLRNGLSGREIAMQMLQDNGIYDVRVLSTPGELTDHYNPENKTVNLSPDVYSGRSVSAAAVAAHECGHAVQHATAYSMLKFRSAIVPLVNISSQLSQWIILAGLGLMFGRSNPTILLIGILLFSLTTLFTLITLPVEYDASNRALAWLERKGMTTPAEHDKAADALKWAARTYLVAAISSVATLLYYILLFLNARDRD
ncbi:membrane protein [Pedobacter quisquiliarum]|jgi:Zn-dependent membrane protease YugP|uniref:Membrane protein n=1 Tax=Pedobacter quisquiliarum TaxID=1834438 RepID=A0A916TYX3_9SPHI|nr:zinc metallopeptidase [Pedobacter quisquiliarum]GGC53109.1 membrane protein [Pedobacter quisquiliarum]